MLDVDLQKAPLGSRFLYDTKLGHEPLGVFIFVEAGTIFIDLKYFYRLIKTSPSASLFLKML